MIKKTIIALGSAIAVLITTPVTAVLAQQTAAAPAAQEQQTAPEPLSDDELEVLVARIALYPDELVALISAAALYPLQIVEAERFLEAREKKPDMKPKDDWDGSIISLLNYPQIVKMMSEDLEWTQSFGDAIANQQKDVLMAIQQLRDEAVAKNIIKTDDKVKVVQEGDNVVIQAANPETIYVPQYPPEMLYEPNYAPAPIGYYDEPYPAYLSGCGLLRRCGHGCGLRRDRRLGRLGCLGWPLERRRHGHRLQQLLQQHQRQGEVERRRLEECRSQQDQLQS